MQKQEGHLGQPDKIRIYGEGEEIQLHHNSRMFVTVHI